MASLIDSVLTNDLRGLQAGLLQGADPNERDANGRTLLIHAAIDGKLEIAKVLLEQSADVNAQNGLGYSALHYAAQNYFPELATLLIGHGAMVDAEDIHGNTPLGRAVFESKGRGGVIAVLLEARADRNHRNKHGKTPTDLAKLIANYDTTQFF